MRLIHKAYQSEEDSACSKDAFYLVEQGTSQVKSGLPKVLALKRTLKMNNLPVLQVRKTETVAHERHEDCKKPSKQGENVKDGSHTICQALF